MSCRIEEYRLVTIGDVSTNEQLCFEWFMCKSAAKLPGAFKPAFWNSLLFQTSYTEPSVFHAVLALTSAHKKEMSSYFRRERSKTLLPLEQFTLKQYSKAIGHLKPHFLANNKVSIRVALVTCVVFVYLEFMRGHYQTGINHLRNGLKLLRELPAYSGSGNHDKLVILRPSPDPIDDYIIEALLGLAVQVQLFSQNHRSHDLALPASRSNLSSGEFVSPNEARQYMDCLLNRIYLLTEQSRLHRLYEDGKPTHKILALRQEIENDLNGWTQKFEVTKQQIMRINVRDAFAYHMLQNYCSMARIMNKASLYPGDEMLYDEYLDEFVFIVMQSVYLKQVAKAPAMVQRFAKDHEGMSNSIVDMGWIPKLYFVIVKCRNHRVRVQALRLMRSVPHKEGIWDSTLAACIAEEVMRIEEVDFYKDVDISDIFDILEHPTERQFALPVLPDSNRLSDIQVGLPDDPAGRVKLRYKRRRGNGTWEDFTREYDLTEKVLKDHDAYSDYQMIERKVGPLKQNPGSDITRRAP